MKLKIGAVLVMALLAILPAGCGTEKMATATVTAGQVVALPAPATDSDTSLEEVLLARRSVRSFSDKAVTLEQLSQLLWAGQGITDPAGKRTVPSAGGLYPLKIYVVIGSIEGVAAGVYVYEPATHSMTRVIEGDRRETLTQAALGQASVRQAALDIVITGTYEITTSKYGERGIRYVQLEAGHAAQNICLQAVGLKLGAVTIGAFDDSSVQKALDISEDATPLYIIPVGNP